MRRHLTATDRERGLAVPMVALLLPVLILMVAFAVDLGIQRSNRRTMQARADVIALDLLRLADGRTENQILTDSSPSFTTLLNGSANRNEVPVTALTVEYGTWNGTTFVGSLPNEIPTAVQVIARQEQDYFFQPGSGTVERTAVASQDGIASFQIGSALLSVDTAQSVILNSLINQTLGGSVALSAVSYEGLIGATISLDELAAELGFGSPDELADATVSADDFYLAAAQVMENQGNTAAATVLETIGLSATGSTQLDVFNLIDAEQGGPSAAFESSVDLWSLVTGSIFAIDGTHTLSIPALTVAVPGASSTITLDVTESPRIALNKRVGHLPVFTQQAAIGINTTLNSFGLNVPALGAVTVSGTIPMSISVAGASGALTDIDCARPGIDVGVTPTPLAITAGVDLDIAAVVDLLGPLPPPPAVLSIAEANVAFTTPVGVTGTSSGASFFYPDEFLPPRGTGTMQPAVTNSLTMPGPLTLVSGSSVTTLGVIPVPLPALTTALNVSVMNPISTALTGVILNQLNRLLGINIGGADIGAINMSCHEARLVH